MSYQFSFFPSSNVHLCQSFYTISTVCTSYCDVKCCFTVCPRGWLCPAFWFVVCSLSVLSDFIVSPQKLIQSLSLTEGVLIMGLWWHSATLLLTSTVAVSWRQLGRWLWPNSWDPSPAVMCELCVCVYVCMCVCVRVYVCVCIYLFLSVRVSNHLIKLCLVLPRYIVISKFAIRYDMT